MCLWVQSESKRLFEECFAVVWVHGEVVDCSGTVGRFVELHRKTLPELHRIAGFLPWSSRWLIRLLVVGHGLLLSLASCISHPHHEARSCDL